MLNGKDIPRRKKAQSEGVGDIAVPLGRDTAELWVARDARDVRASERTGPDNVVSEHHATGTGNSQACWTWARA